MIGVVASAVEAEAELPSEVRSGNLAAVITCGSGWCCNVSHSVPGTIPVMPLFVVSTAVPGTTTRVQCRYLVRFIQYATVVF